MSLLLTGAIIAGACLLRSEYEKVCLKLKTYVIENDKIPASFDGVRIAVLSDLHNKKFGVNNEELYRYLKAAHPDYILSAGDLITKTKPEETGDVAQFVGSLTKLCPVYLGNGNHEIKLRQYDVPGLGVTAYDRYVRHLQQFGVTVLADETAVIERDGESICVTGLDLGLEHYAKGTHVAMKKGYMEAKLGQAEADKFHILLGHYPNYFPEYAAWGADLVLAGHMHGGTVRLPGVGGLMSPNFEFFPTYDKGLFTRKGSTMVVSPGLGTHSINVRFGENFPEIPVIVLRKKK